MAQVDFLLEKIKSSNLDEAAKQYLEATLPQLSRQFIDSLIAYIFSTSQELTEETSQILLGLVSAVDTLHKGDSTLAEKTLIDSEQNPDWEFGKAAMPLLLEIKRMTAAGEGITPRIIAAANILTAKILSYLPKNQLESLLEHEALYFLKQCDLQMEIKRNYLPKSYGDDEGLWTRSLAKSLEKNQEIFGNKGIVVNGKTLQPTIQNWILDYVSYFPKPVINRTAFEQVQYLEKSPNLKSVTIGDKKILENLIKLYSWFFKPLVTEKEIESYEHDLALKDEAQSNVPPAQKLKVKDIIYKKETIADKSLFSQSPGIQNFPRPTSDITPVTAGWAEQAALRRKEDQEKIQGKLQELKSRANNSH